MKPITPHGPLLRGWWDAARSTGPIQVTWPLLDARLLLADDRALSTQVDPGEQAATPSCGRGGWSACMASGATCCGAYGHSWSSMRCMVMSRERVRRQRGCANRKQPKIGGQGPEGAGGISTVHGRSPPFTAPTGTKIFPLLLDASGAGGHGHTEPAASRLRCVMTRQRGVDHMPAPCGNLWPPERTPTPALPPRRPCWHRGVTRWHRDVYRRAQPRLTPGSQPASQAVAPRRPPLSLSAAACRRPRSTALS